MKTKEELNALKEEVETKSKNLNALSEEDLAQVSGGVPTVRVKEDDVAVLNTTTAADALQGKVPGVEIAEKAGKPGSKSEILVR